MGMRFGLAAIVAAGLLLFGAGVARADALDDSIVKVKESVKKGETVKAIDVMKEVAKSDDPRAVACLIGLTDDSNELVAVAAYELVAPKKNAAFLGALKQRAGNKRIAETSGQRFLAVLAALAVYADKSALPVFADVFTRYRASNADYSIAAVRGYAAVRSKDVVDELIKWLLACESTSAYATSKSASVAPNEETKANYAKCHEEIVKQLQALTQEKFTAYKEWKEWWKEAERTFKFVDPPKK